MTDEVLESVPQTGVVVERSSPPVVSQGTNPAHKIQPLTGQEDVLVRGRSIRDVAELIAAHFRRAKLVLAGVISKQSTYSYSLKRGGSTNYRQTLDKLSTAFLKQLEKKLPILHYRNAVDPYIRFYDSYIILSLIGQTLPEGTSVYYVNPRFVHGNIDTSTDNVMTASAKEVSDNYGITCNCLLKSDLYITRYIRYINYLLRKNGVGLGLDIHQIKMVTDSPAEVEDYTRYRLQIEVSVSPGVWVNQVINEDSDATVQEPISLETLKTFSESILANAANWNFLPGQQVTIPPIENQSLPAYSKDSVFLCIEDMKKVLQTLTRVNSYGYRAFHISAAQ